MNSKEANLDNVHTIRLILGDQLSLYHSWFQEEPSASILYVMIEAREEAEYATHHIQKVIGFFSAMRSFANSLKERGYNVYYLSLDDSDNLHSIPAQCLNLINLCKAKTFEYQEPDEWRLEQSMKVMCEALPIPHRCVSTEHFMSDDAIWESIFKGKKTRIMETFYRVMRKHHGILMEGNEPLGGAWNFDKNNRKSLPKSLDIPAPLLFTHDVSDIHEMIKSANIKTIGIVDPLKFSWPISQEESHLLLQYFADHLLHNFGTYQDAMTIHSWAVFHSRLSFSLNTKMLHPKEVIDAALHAWKKYPERISISQVEGFTRQILGWREYMRGIYREYMPEYANKNFFEHKRALPSWFWTGETEMQCLSTTIKQSLEHAYAHHIQRLMITGNFALLAGIHPDEVDAWYLGIYIDALEWVEMPNTRGMSQFADGGIVGTKPYVSSASYINSMSDFCKSCAFNPKKKVGEDACPFNSLYWHFYNRNRHLLADNPRIGMMYSVWDKMQNKQELLNQAEQFLEKLH